MEYFGFEEGTRALACNGDKEEKSEEWEEEELDKREAKEFRGLAATLNFLSQDSPELQFPIKQCSNPPDGALIHLDFRTNTRKFGSFISPSIISKCLRTFSTPPKPSSTFLI